MIGAVHLAWDRGQTSGLGQLLDLISFGVEVGCIVNVDGSTFMREASSCIFDQPLDFKNQILLDLDVFIIGRARSKTVNHYIDGRIAERLHANILAGPRGLDNCIVL